MDAMGEHPMGVEGSAVRFAPKGEEGGGRGAVVTGVGEGQGEDGGLDVGEFVDVGFVEGEGFFGEAGQDDAFNRAARDGRGRGGGDEMC